MKTIQPAFSIGPAVRVPIVDLSRQWIDDAEVDVIDWICFTGRKQFTSDDIRQVVGQPPQPNWMGSLIAKLRADGYIKPANCAPVRSTRHQANGRKVAVWEVGK